MPRKGDRKSEVYRVSMRFSTLKKLEESYLEWRERGNRGPREEFLLDMVAVWKRYPQISPEMLQ